MPFHQQTFENKIEDERGTNVDAMADNQNDAIFFDVDYAFRPNFHLYTEVFIDEFQIDKGDRQKLDDEIGLIIGVTGGSEYRKGFWHYTLELSRLSTWLYHHGGIETDWVYNDHNLGFRDGSDLWKWTIKNEWWFDNKTMISIQFTKTVRGEIEIDNEWDPFSTKNKDFPFGMNQIENIIQGEFFWFPKSWGLLQILFKFDHINNYMHIRGKSKKTFDSVLALQLLL